MSFPGCFRFLRSDCGSVALWRHRLLGQRNTLPHLLSRVQCLSDTFWTTEVHLAGLIRSGVPVVLGRRVEAYYLSCSIDLSM